MVIRSLGEEEKSSDSLERTIDGGADAAASAAGAAYDASQGIGTAAGAASQAAADSAAAAGASASGAAGAGAAAGTAAGGPAGTVLGAVIGLGIGILAKPLVKGAIVIIVFLVAVFSSIPSMFFEEPVDMADSSGPQAVYQQFKDYVLQAYQQEIDNRKQEIEEDFQARRSSGEFSEYDHVTMSYSFIPSEAQFLSEVQEASVLIIAMFEIHTDDWRKASFDHFKSAVDSVNFWDRTVEVEKESEEHEVTWDDEESTLHVTMTYNIYDRGVERFREKFGLQDDREFLKSVEMAYNTKLLFGETAELPLGGVSGGAAGSFPGGGTHNAIRQALGALEEKRDFFGGNTAMPIRSYSGITSEFGPRNYAPDPIHTGIDFAAESGTPIYAAMDGIVLLRLSSPGGFGNHIILYHGGEVTTMYAHMSSFGDYQVGDPVSRGDVIGYVGSTGLSTGPHLHFEYQKNGSAYNPREILPL